MKRTSFILLAVAQLAAGEVKNSSSFQGFSGLWNTPNAEVLEEGIGQFLFTDQVDNLRPEEECFKEGKTAENYFLNFGLLPNVEFGGRYSYINHYLSSRSAQLKVKLPFFSTYKFLPSVALGMQDVGGGAPTFRTNYIVASEKLGPLRVSMGYGTGDKRMEGLFGGVEYQPLSWLQLVGDYDGEIWYSGIKLTHPVVLDGKEIALGLFAKNSYDCDKNHIDLGLMVNVPLGYQERKGVTTVSPYDEPPIWPIEKKGVTPEANRSVPAIPSIAEDHAAAIRKTLIAYGFRDLQISEDGDTFFLAYENDAFDWNQLDGLGVVLGVLTERLLGEKKRFSVTLTKSGIPLFTLFGSPEKYSTFLRDGIPYDDLLKIDMSTKGNQRHTGLTGNPIRFLPQLVLYPEFSLIDGSEYGNMDYIVSLKPELYTTVAKGTQISIRGNTPLIWSKNFNDGEIFSYRRRYPLEPRIDNLLLNLAFRPFPSSGFLNAMQTGLFDVGLYGGMYQGIFPEGNHLFKVKVAYFDDTKEDRKREMHLFTYRYYFDQLDINFRVAAGRYFYGDRGGSLEMQRFFGDTSLSLEFCHTDGDNVAKFALSFPLTPRKRITLNSLQIRGADLTYRRQKTIVSEGEASYARPRSAVDITTRFELEKFYFNNDRLTPDYIHAHMERLRSSYLKFRKP